jgi:UDP-glucose 4-epimerase
MTMRILITGGFGYVGGRIAAHMIQEGYQVIIGSRYSCKVPIWLPQSEVARIVWEDDNSLERCCDSVDVVIHAAGMNAHECSANPMAALQFNGLATARLVSAASQAGVQRFIYLSTAHVYASPLTGIITEETCTSNLHPYATSHLSGEHAVLFASQTGKIHGTVLRLSNAFGPPVLNDANCWMLLVNDLCKQAVETSKLVLQTNGLQKRDFVALKDVCRAIKHIITMRYEDYEFGLFNLASGVSITILEMAKRIAERSYVVLKLDPPIIRSHPYQEIDNSTLEINCSKLINTRFTLMNDINNEIDRTLEMCMNNKN